MRELLEKIEARRVQVGQSIARLREEITELEGRLAAAEQAAHRLEITRETVLELAGDGDTGPVEPLPPGYREVVAVVEQAGQAGAHAKQVCQALGVGTEPRHVESTRAKLKRLVDRDILTEPDPGLFVLPHPTSPTPEIDST
jgi:hypothetical protein